MFWSFFLCKNDLIDCETKRFLNFIESSVYHLITVISWYVNGNSCSKLCRIYTLVSRQNFENFLCCVRDCEDYFDNERSFLIILCLSHKTWNSFEGRLNLFLCDVANTFALFYYMVRNYWYFDSFDCTVLKSLTKIWTIITKLKHQEIWVLYW